MSVLATCMHVYYMYAWCAVKPEEVVRFPGTGVMDGFKLPPFGFWELNLDSLQEQQVLLLLSLSPARG